MDKNDIELLDIEIEIKLLNTENSKAKQTFMTSDVNHIVAGQLVWEVMERRWVAGLSFCKIFKVQRKFSRCKENFQSVKEIRNISLVSYIFLLGGRAIILQNFQSAKKIEHIYLAYIIIALLPFHNNCRDGQRTIEKIL